MTDAGPLVSVFRMSRVEPQAKEERLILWLRLDEFDTSITNQLSRMPQSPVRLFLVVRIAPDRFEFVEMIIVA